jgi:phosphate acetyltransferase
MLIGKTAKVGYFRPIIEDFEDGMDNHIETVISHFGLDIAFEDAFVLKSKLIKKKTKVK